MVILYINPSRKHYFINVNVVKRLQILAKHIQSINFEGENVKFFKYLKVTMDKYVLHSYFHTMDMDNVDIVLGYPWNDLVGIVTIDVQNKLLKLW